MVNRCIEPRRRGINGAIDRRVVDYPIPFRYYPGSGGYGIDAVDADVKNYAVSNTDLTRGDYPPVVKGLYRAKGFNCGWYKRTPGSIISIDRMRMHSPALPVITGWLICRSINANPGPQPARWDRSGRARSFR